ncbi:tyrosine-type recombinase/integrase [Roseibium suaedae]|uniref:Integrase n=1 Tax=Roseibium suaedae TaxID=735517 RepID=A0A1M6ZK09_9HYPH|nr:integrase arm-type DNA-binding domain-containing protein [Roseibium suaedae]SHL30861.1 Integrase [Roseibium suaedae]
MTRSIHKLSPLKVPKLEGPKRHSDGGGLYLNVTGAGTRSWIFMWAVNGKRREMGLGSYPAISLADARSRADDCRKLVEHGFDPISERDRQLEKTFGECAEEYIAAHKSSWKNEKHQGQWGNTLTTYCARMWKLPVSKVNDQQVLACLRPIWASKNETASRLRGRIERVLDYAKSNGWRDGENPARWRGNLQHILPKRQKLARGHMAALHFNALPEFFERLQAANSMSARALEFLILTASRSGEVREAKWSEFDLEKKIWTVPAARMKAQKEHSVPLSEQAAALIGKLKANQVSEFVFPGQKIDAPMSDMTLTGLLRRWKVTTVVDGRERTVTAHGFRSTFRDWCGNETDYPRELAEEALAHQIGNAVERAYRRQAAIEKRRKLMQDWANYCVSCRN